MGLALDEPKETDDQELINEIPVLINSADRGYLEDSVVDYEKSEWGEGFTVRGAEATSC